MFVRIGAFNLYFIIKVMGVVDRDGALAFAVGMDISEFRKNADDVKKIIGGVTNTTKKEVEEAIRFQKRVIEEVRAELEPLEKEFRNLDLSPTNDPQITKQREEAKKAMQQMRTEYDAAVESLRDLEDSHAAVGEKQELVMRQIRALKSEMVNLKMAGMENTDMYREKSEQLGELSTAMRELKKEQELLSTGGSNITGLTSGIRGLAGAMTAGAGAMGLLNSESESYARVQTRIQSLMGITIGLQAASDTLHRTSAFRIHTLAKAKGVWSAAVQFLNTQMKINIGLSKAMVATGIGLILAAIGGLIVMLNRWRKSQQEVNVMQQRFNEIGKEVARTAVEQQAHIKRLMNVAEDYTRDLETRNKVVAELNRLMPEYNGHIDREGRLIANSAEALEIYLRNLVRVEQTRRLIAEQGDIDGQISDLQKSRGSDARISNARRMLIGHIAMQNENIQQAEQERASNRQNARIDRQIEELTKRRNKLQETISYNLANMSSAEILETFGLRADAVVAASENIYDALQREIDAYNRIIEQKRRQSNELIRTEFELEQARIDVMQDGFERRQAQFDLNLKRELQSLEEREQAMIRANTEIDRAIWEQSGVGGVFNYTSDLTGEQAEQIAALRNAANDAHVRANEQMLADLLQQFQTHEQQRTEIVERFARERAKIERANTDGQFDANIEELNRQEQEALVRLDTIAQDRTKIISRMFEDMSQKSIEELREIHKEAQALFEFLQGGEWDDSKGAIFGLTKERFDDIVGDPTKLREFQRGVENIDFAIWNLKTTAEQVRFALNEMFNPDGAMTAVESVNLLTNAMQGYADAALFTADALRAVGQFSGNDRLQDASESISTAAELAGSTMRGAKMGAKVGGPWGAVAGAAVGLAKGIFQASARARESARQAREEMERFQRAVEAGERRHQALLRERLRLVQQIGETDLQYQQRITAELLRQKNEVQSEFDDLLNKMTGERDLSGIPARWKSLLEQMHNQNMGYISGQRTERYGGFLGIGRNTRVVNEYGSLAGKSFEELERLFEEGRLTEGAAELFKQLRNLKNESEDINRQWEQIQESIRQSVTGTTHNSILDSIIQGFRDGKRSAADFADSFGDLMQGALLASLTTAGEDEVREWYERFAKKAADGGLTEADIAALRAEYLAIIERLAQQAEQIEKVTGEVIGQNRNGVTGELQAAMTEGTASQLVGLWNMTAMDIREIREWLRSNPAPRVEQELNAILNELHAISRNTRDTADNTTGIKEQFEAMNKKLEEIKKNIKPNNSRG